MEQRLLSELENLHEEWTQHGEVTAAASRLGSVPGHESFYLYQSLIIRIIDVSDTL